MSYPAESAYIILFRCSLLNFHSFFFLYFLTWHLRTPLGEAQMNGNEEIVALIKDNYTTNVPEQYIWHNEVSRETAAWYDTWDDEQQKLQWARLGPDGNVEVSATPPPIDIQRVIEAREAFNERTMIRSIHPKSLLSIRQLEYEKFLYPIERNVWITNRNK